MTNSGRRRHPSLAEQAQLWRCWKDGQSARDIARQMGRADGTVHGWLAAAGGFAPRVPKRSARALSMQEREEISRGISAGESIRSIAMRLCRPPSTISREINRNGGAKRYRATRADELAWVRAKRPQACALQAGGKLAQLVGSKLALRWSPQQIAGWLKQQYPGDTAMTVSHETIYRTLFVQARAGLKKELTQYLRRRTVLRRPKNAAAPATRFHLKDALPISQRPPQAQDRAVPGHWEGDLLFGGLHSQIATLVERRSRYVMLVKVDGKDAHSVLKGLTERVQSLPQGLMNTLTWDCGSEMALHKQFSIATDVEVYFCDPSSPWQRGTNENTNGLLRQYFPKGQSMAHLTQADLDQVAHELNGRPRMTLGYATPAEVLFKTVASTG